MLKIGSWVSEHGLGRECAAAPDDTYLGSDECCLNLSKTESSLHMYSLTVGEYAKMSSKYTKSIVNRKSCIADCIRRWQVARALVNPKGSRRH